MIETITLRNYRGHTDTTIRCARFTVLVGENACGKTSVLKAVQWVSRGIEDKLSGGMLRRGALQLDIGVAGVEAERAWRIDAMYRPATTGDELELVRAGVQNLDDGSMASRPRAMFLALNTDDLAATSAPRSVRPVLTPSGAGLASVLAHLKLAETERFERIVAQLREVVPITKDLGFTRAQVTEMVPRAVQVEGRAVEVVSAVTTIHDVLLFDFIDAPRVPASLVSEGTLLVLGVLTALETLDRDTYIDNDGVRNVMHHPVAVVLIDDLDRALHPRAQRTFVTMLRRVLDSHPNLQIIATSHSPYLVDSMRPEEVVVLGRDPGGRVVAKRLDEFPDDRLRGMLSTGELWMSEGDDWVSR
ncbi:MAG: AAA family ATPase [Deltaproteobacteria bacterium]|nr:AAA family ATPase [Myxococcales bacterium]MDP3219944.1 AAA family ATPase [Deltaproteobacteria bacterium]